MAQYDLTPFGIIKPVDIDGVLTELQLILGTPVVFLFDEHHETPACIIENIKNGDEIRSKTTIDLVGVESHEERVLPNGESGEESNAYNKHPEFANHFVPLVDHVYGLEHVVIADEMFNDTDNGLWTTGYRIHPYNYLRSYHYIATLFRIYRENQLTGNLFLNAGKEHIEHLVNLIQWGAIDSLAGQQASYIRLRGSSYPST